MAKFGDFHRLMRRHPDASKVEDDGTFSFIFRPHTVRDPVSHQKWSFSAKLNDSKAKKSVLETCINRQIVLYFYCYLAFRILYFMRKKWTISSTT